MVDVVSLGCTVVALAQGLATELVRPYLLLLVLSIQVYYWLWACGLGIADVVEMRGPYLLCVAMALVWRALLPHMLIATGVADGALTLVTGALMVQVMLHLLQGLRNGSLRGKGPELFTFAIHALLCLAVHDEENLIVVAAMFTTLVGGLAGPGQRDRMSTLLVWPLGLHSISFALRNSHAATVLWVLAGMLAVCRTPHRKGRIAEPSGGGEEDDGIPMETHMPVECHAHMVDTCPSQILDEAMQHRIWQEFPMRLKLREWRLCYCFERDGAGLPQLFRKLHELPPRAHGSGCLLVVKDVAGWVFGAYASVPFEPQAGCFGTGETFVFTFPKQGAPALYKWTRTNHLFLAANGGDTSFIGVGGGDQGYALWLDHGLCNGSSSSCETFGSPCLASRPLFDVLKVEVWVFG